MLEHNNRKQAKKLAEFITGKALREYTAEKVHKYAGVNVSVFDGACGSGQLEQYIKMSHLTAVEIQEPSCQAIRHNFPTADIYHQSFFEFDEPLSADCVVMNPPFSLKFKDLSDSERAKIQAQFAWKKSGVVDDIFVLKSHEYAKRFSFFILSSGLSSRNTEKKLRELIGNQIVECNRICNAFDDTSIDVMFLILDKQKTDSQYHSEYVDFETGEKYEQSFTIDVSRWEIASKPIQYVTNDLDLGVVSCELAENDIKHLDDMLSLQHTLAPITGLDFKAFCERMLAVVEKWRLQCESS